MNQAQKDKVLKIAEHASRCAFALQEIAQALLNETASPCQAQDVADLLQAARGIDQATDYLDRLLMPGSPLVPMPAYEPGELG